MAWSLWTNGQPNGQTNGNCSQRLSDFLIRTQGKTDIIHRPNVRAFNCIDDDNVH